MAKLTAMMRRRMPKQDFAGPHGSYPIEDKNHARMALAMASAHASPAEAARIRAAVRRKFPSIKQGGK